MRYLNYLTAICVGFILLFTSCSSSQLVMRPSRVQTTKWVNGTEVLVDTSQTFSAQCKKIGESRPVQFMLHLVNKGVQSVLVDPNQIYTYQTNTSDNTYKVNCTSPDFIAQNVASKEDNDIKVGTAIAVGVFALLLVGAVAVAASKSSNTSHVQNNQPKSHVEHQQGCNRQHYDSHCNRNDEDDKRRTYAPPTPSIPPTDERLRKHTLEPGAEVKGIIGVNLIENIKKLILVVPGKNENDSVKFAYDVTEITY